MDHACVDQMTADAATMLSYGAPLHYVLRIVIVARLFSVSHARHFVLSRALTRKRHNLYAPNSKDECSAQLRSAAFTLQLSDRQDEVYSAFGSLSTALIRIHLTSRLCSFMR